MYTLAIANQKGGVGKTTTAAAIAQGLHNIGCKVFSLDADPQANLSDLLQAEAGASLYDVIQGNAETAAAIQTTTAGDILRADKRLAEKGILEGKGELGKLKSILQPLQHKYDLCIVDTPPQIGALTIAALMAADGFIVPAKADRFSVQGLQEVYTTSKAINPALELLGVIVTQYNARTTLNKAVLDALQKQAEVYHSRVILPPIRRTIAAEEWQYTGDIYGDHSTAAQDYAEVCRQIPKLIKLKRR